MIDKYWNSPQMIRVRKFFARWRRRSFSGGIKMFNLKIATIVSLVAILYWGMIASDRYVSEAHIMIQKTNVATGISMDLTAVLAGVSSSNRSDQLLLRDHLLSVDMLKKIDDKLNLRAHYSGSSIDLFSRMLSRDSYMEVFHKYYLSMVSVELDNYSGLLVIKSQAFEPNMAYEIAHMMVVEGERYMNTLSRELALEHVDFLQNQIDNMGEKALSARKALLEYQNLKGLISPKHMAQSLSEIIYKLEGELSELKAKKNTAMGYMNPMAPEVVALDYQISAIEKQILQEKSRLVSQNGDTLNVIVEEYQRLEMTAELAQNSYKTALIALEQGRVEAARNLKKVSVLQMPTTPQYPEQPRRLYNISVFILFTLLITGVVKMLAAIVRDHQD
ncbi:MAG: chain-length determining protein [Deltaproteobacteria bacterium]|nr:chain-length determining protein [Deltaproteobacteria bacterium]